MRKLAMVIAGLSWMAGCAQQPAKSTAAQAVAAAPAPPPEDFRTFCTHAACQHDVDVDLVQADGGKYHRHFDLLPPSVQPQLITIYPGQKVQAAATFKDGKFAGWIDASAAKADDVILSFDLEQGSIGMTLSIHNDGQKLVKLDLSKLDLQAASDEPQHTSSCPVFAGKGDFELWSEPVFEIDVVSADISPAAAGICN
ncbi:MAG TPA: hypothetical protein VGM16_06620 [Gammaproteobacteria bacterium]|jgi:hypothetical protein